MSEEIIDATVETNEDSSPEEVSTPEEVQSEEVAPSPSIEQPKEQYVPYDRFKEVNEGYKELKAWKEQVESKNINNQPEAPKWRSPAWIPNDYPEIIEAAKQEVLGELSAKEQAKAQQEQQAQQKVAELNTWIDSKKQSDKTFDENAFSKFVTEYNFPVSEIAQLEPIYKAFNAVKQAEKNGIDKALKVQGQPDVVAKPTAKTTPSGLSLDQIRSFKDSRELARFIAGQQ